MSLPTARDLMTDRVLTAQADWSLQELASFFTEHSISGAPVISDYGGVIGVVSVTDIARYDSEASSETEEEAEREEPPAFYLGDADVRDDEALNALRGRPQATVRDIMMPAVFTVEEDAPIHEVADRMVRAQIHRLFVVHAGTKRDIAGLISAIDVLEWVRDQGSATDGT
ncbi:MAG: CBS domain-containing protein [Salinibacter sp.]|uniref:CBS domain-containing protein n=1 Tax=Salinibacter sp. TaxID=2065818 RepID=UPI002FC28F74